MHGIPGLQSEVAFFEALSYIQTLTYSAVWNRGGRAMQVSLPAAALVIHSYNSIP